MNELAAQKLAEATTSSSGRSSVTIHGGREHQLRQTLLALRAGAGLSEHESPGEATLQVLLGSIVLRTATQQWVLAAGDYMVIPDEVHAVDVPEPAAFLLTIALKVAHND